MAPLSLRTAATRASAVARGSDKRAGTLLYRSPVKPTDPPGHGIVRNAGRYWPDSLIEQLASEALRRRKHREFAQAPGGLHPFRAPPLCLGWRAGRSLPQASARAPQSGPSTKRSPAQSRQSQPSAPGLFPGAHLPKLDSLLSWGRGRTWSCRLGSVVRHPRLVGPVVLESFRVLERVFRGGYARSSEDFLRLGH